MGAASIGNRALFGGGCTQFDIYDTAVDIFDVNTKKWSVSALSQARQELAATSIGTKALFAVVSRSLCLSLELVCAPGGQMQCRC